MCGRGVGGWGGGKNENYTKYFGCKLEEPIRKLRLDKNNIKMYHKTQNT
jgi:hypothetical protein